MAERDEQVDNSMILDTPFLTDIDSRAAVKGSRDPLGIQQVWVRLGRYVVGNLTTVSTSVRDFTVLLLGYHFIESLVDELGPGSELPIFLRWEQLAAYARGYVNKDFSFRGTDRVSTRLAESSNVVLSAESGHQILSNQKIYGLWGLYTIPGTASGILQGKPLRLSNDSRDLCQSLYLPLLEQGCGKNAKAILDVLRYPIAKLDLAGKHNAMIRSIGSVLTSKWHSGEQDWYRDRLLHGGPRDSTDGRQRLLAELVSGTQNMRRFAWSPALVGALVQDASRRGKSWESLAYRLDRIRANETVMASASMLFTYLLGMHDCSVQKAAERIQTEWGKGLDYINPEEFGRLRDDLASSDVGAAERWCHIAETLSSGQYDEAIRLLAEQNNSVMQRRNGAAWMEIRQGILHVRFPEEKGELLPKQDLKLLWRFSYFIDSLRIVAMTLQEPSHG